MSGIVKAHIIGQGHIKDCEEFSAIDTKMHEDFCLLDTEELQLWQMNDAVCLLAYR